MKSKRAVIYIVAGVVCALVAAWAAHKYLSQSKPSQPQIERVEILLALRDINFGEVLTPRGGEQEPNVAFISWPKNSVPAEAIREKSYLAEGTWRAWSDIVKHEPILKPRIISDEQFIPEDMYLERVKVDKQDIKTGMLRPGMSVDVLQIVDKKPMDFMRCVKLYAVGSLDRLGRPLPKKDEEISPNVLLLIKKEHREDFIGADKSHDLLLRPAAGTHPDGPVLVNALDKEMVREEEAKGLLAEARELAKEQEYRQALEKLNSIVDEYGDFTKIALEASKLTGDVRARFANSLFKQAETALDEREDFTRTLSLLDRIERECPETGIEERIAALRARAEESLEEHRRVARFEAMRQETRDAIERGDLPAAEQKLKELEKLAADVSQTEEGQPTLQHVCAQLQKELKDSRGKYRLDRRVVETLLGEGQLERAQDKVEEIRERFPDHPDNASLQRLVDQAQDPELESPENTAG